jgi:6-phosphogluconolactonase (cycloisomerase 2 family)
VAPYAYVGCYTTPDRDGRGRGINVYQMDPQSGAWTHLQLLGDVDNPSWLTLDPGQRHLYSVHGGNGFSSVSAFAIDRSSGRLSHLNSQPCGSPNPVAISISPLAPYAVVAGYNAGKVAALPIHDDGSLGPMSDLVTLVGEPGPHPTEQTVSHPHHIPIDPTGQHFVVPDKGYDRTYVFRIDAATGNIAPSEQGSVKARPGAAPRHLAFHPSARYAYQCNEIDSTVTTFAYDPPTGRLDELEVQTTLPSDFGERNTTAEIQVAPSGRFVYLSNRGHNSIAIFSVDQDTGRLGPVGWEPTQGRQPRFFALSPDGSWLYAANQATDTIVTFRVDRERGTLTPTGQVIETGSPVSIVFAGAQGA